MRAIILSGGNCHCNGFTDGIGEVSSRFIGDVKAVSSTCVLRELRVE